MSFNSINFLVFFPVIVFLYFLLPKKIRMYWLLVASYYFYMSWDARFGLLILFSTVITYICGLLLNKVKRSFCGKHQKALKLIVLFSSLFINLGLLFYFKYTNFAVNNIIKVLHKIGMDIQYPEFDIVLPVGISFFIFQAIGYTVDVYRDEIQAEKNPFRYALFISFFPQLVAGPIERSKNLLPQMRNPSEFDVDNAKYGLLTMAYGLFMKIVVADNISVIIDPIFGSPDNYSGMMLLFATIMFAFQIYCDFNGYTQIAIGSAKVLGFKLNQNFDSPYMGSSVKDFWRRWHISLTSWFRDYLYIPLGGSRKGKFRKQINTMLVFLCSGLWHGAGWHYVAWGALNGLFSVFEDLIKPIKEKIDKHLSIDKEKWMYKVFQRIITFILIDFTWLFFRAPELTTALHILKKIVSDCRLAWLINFEFVSAFESDYVLMTVIIPLFIVIALDVIKYYGKDIKAAIFSQQIVFRWVIYTAIMFAILYWGLYGTEYEQTQFIYFQF
ncbi:MAG: MBOAT family protein [Lachnospiraceae bacterium]|nr:MBOAT family protein [Lachnospiraceae bacterium]